LKVPGSELATVNREKFARLQKSMKKGKMSELTVRDIEEEVLDKR
jgi:hypothetical protein